MSLLACDGLGWQVAGRWILHDATVSLAPGALTAVIGVNGSGKTTLLHLLSGLRTPTAGRVLLEGRDLSAIPRREVARRVAVMEQMPTARVELSVRDVVALGRIPHEGRWGVGRRNPIAEEAMARTGVSALAKRSWATLSGGERQRVQLARALAQEPAILMLDEPTNHLDLRHQLGLLATVRDLGLTTVAVLHDLDLAAAFSDRLIVLDDGAVIADGPTSAVLTDALVREHFGVLGHVVPGPPSRFSWMGLADDA